MRGLWFLVVLFVLRVSVFTVWAVATWRAMVHGYFYVALTAVLIVAADLPMVYRVIRQLQKEEVREWPV